MSFFFAKYYILKIKLIINNINSLFIIFISITVFYNNNNYKFKLEIEFINRYFFL